MRFRVSLAAGLVAFAIASPAQAYVNAQHAGLQVALRSLGLYCGPIDGLVGPQTIAAIKAAQRRAHLPETGLADSKTRVSLGPLGGPLFGDRVLRAGEFGFDVSVLQFLLTQHRLYDGPLDGYLGPETAAALRRYQRGVRLEPDGILGPRTRSALALESPVAVRSRTTVENRIYVVRSGDSLTSIAARFHVSMAALARANHVTPARVLLIGKRLRIPGASRTVATALEATPTAVRERLDYWSAHLGVSTSLVRALAWMESGYQPNVVSQAGAKGVLQTLPSTRDFVEDVLVRRSVPQSLDGDIEVGVRFLQHLLDNFGGDERLALAAWYQGEAAVRKNGVYKVTKPFVDNVLALKSRM